MAVAPAWRHHHSAQAQAVIPVVPLCLQQARRQQGQHAFRQMAGHGAQVVQVQPQGAANQCLNLPVRQGAQTLPFGRFQQWTRVDQQLDLRLPLGGNQEKAQGVTSLQPQHGPAIQAAFLGMQGQQRQMHGAPGHVHPGARALCGGRAQADVPAIPTPGVFHPQFQLAGIPGKTGRRGLRTQAQIQQCEDGTGQRGQHDHHQGQAQAEQADGAGHQAQDTAGQCGREQPRAAPRQADPQLRHAQHMRFLLPQRRPTR